MLHSAINVPPTTPPRFSFLLTPAHVSTKAKSGGSSTVYHDRLVVGDPRQVVDPACMIFDIALPLRLCSDVSASEASALKVKAEILSAILEHVRTEGYTQAQLVDLLDEYQPSESNLLKGWFWQLGLAHFGSLIWPPPRNVEG